MVLHPRQSFFVAASALAITGAVFHSSMIPEAVAEEANVAEAIEFLKTAGGSGETIRIEGSAGTDGSLIRLMRPSLNASVDFKFRKQDLRGVAQGLRGELAAQDRKEVRDCMKPHIERILDILLEDEPQSRASETVHARAGVLTAPSPAIDPSEY